MKFKLRILAVLVFGCTASCCSSYTSIRREPNGEYAIMGWQGGSTPPQRLWIGTYDPRTKTMILRNVLNGDHE